MPTNMPLSHSDCVGGSSKGRFSNKTMYIALNSQERMDRMNMEAANEIAQRLLELEDKQNRLQYYASLLERRAVDSLAGMYEFAASGKQGTPFAGKIPPHSP